MNKLPEKLTQLRKYNGFSQQTVAEKAQVSVLDYMAWENGRAIPDVDHLILLATRCRCCQRRICMKRWIFRL